MLDLLLTTLDFYFYDFLCWYSTPPQFFHNTLITVSSERSLLRLNARLIPLADRLWLSTKIATIIFHPSCKNVVDFRDYFSPKSLPVLTKSVGWFQQYFYKFPGVWLCRIVSYSRSNSQTSYLFQWRF